MKMKSVIFLVVVLLITGRSLIAGHPGNPVAHWAFEEGSLQTIFNNANPGTYNGFRGRTFREETTYDAAWTTGLNGSSSALWFTNNLIVKIEGIADDTNGDRIADSGPLAGSFSMFMRVKLASADYQVIMVADKSPTNNIRGFYFDTLPSGLYGDTWTLGFRFSFNSPTNNTSHSAGGQSSDIAVTNVNSIGFTFLADPDPSDDSDEGTLQFYVNGATFGSVKSHNAPCLGVNGGGLWFGNNFEVEQAKGTTIDDVAIWDKVLTADEMMHIETNALPQPDSGPGRTPGYPYAHWPFNEGSGEIIKDIRTRNINDGYLGLSPSDSTRNPTWVTGLNGSASALQYDNTDIVSIDNIANDTNNDRRADSGPFAGSFTLFSRIDLPNTNRIPLFNADKHTPVTDRGFYMDIYNSYQDASGDWHTGIRISVNSPTNTIPSFQKGGTASTILNTNIETIIISFLADANPGDSSNNGMLEFYVNGELFHSLAHNCPYLGVSGNNKFWLAKDTYNSSSGSGMIMDDIAIWGKALNESEIYYIINDGIPIEPPTGTVIILK